MTGADMPTGLSFTDQVYFLGLAHIYDRYRAGFLSRDQGAALKARLSARRDRIARRWAFEDRLRRHTARLYRQCQAAMNAYRKHRSLENADRLLRAVDGALREEGSQHDPHS